MRCTVIGAGIVGAAIADQLALGGVHVTVLEQAVPAAQASSKSFGWINANFAETPAYYRLRRAAIDRFRTLCEELDLAHAVRWNGSLWWEDEGDALVAQYKQMQSFGYPSEFIDAATFSKLEPALANPPAASIRADLEGAANPALVTHALLNRAAENDALVINGCEVVEISHIKSGEVQVLTSLGIFTSDHVVVAAGAQAEDLLEKAGIRLPMDNKQGIILRTTPVEPLVDHVIMSPDVHFHQGPDGRLTMGEIYSGGVANQGPDIRDFAQEILSRAKARLPNAGKAKLEAAKLGLRPVPHDGLPVIGPARNCPGIYIASMHSGVTLAPLVGQLVASEVLNETQEDILSEFRHDRFN